MCRRPPPTLRHGYLFDAFAPDGIEQQALQSPNDVKKPCIPLSVPKADFVLSEVFCDEHAAQLPLMTRATGPSYEQPAVPENAVTRQRVPEGWIQEQPSPKKKDPSPLLCSSNLRRVGFAPNCSSAESIGAAAPRLAA